MAQVEVTLINIPVNHYFGRAWALSRGDGLTVLTLVISDSHRG